jgi:parallel beta-helix repeat protein
VLRYGATGSGSNDLAAINLAASAAAIDGTLYFPEGYVFGISGWITITNGTRLVHGSGRILCLNNGNSLPSGVLLAGIAQGQSANVSTCRVEGLYIDRNGQWSSGIYGSNVDNVQIIGNTIVNGNSGYSSDYAGIYLPSFASSDTGVRDVLVQGNYVEGDETTSVVGGADGIAVTGTYTTGAYANLTDLWKGAFTLPTTVNPAYNIQISDNTVIGGYYGISFVETRYSIISGNQVASNIRNISQQSNCIANIISGNLCRDSNSSGINGGFGVADCTITGNKIYSTRAQGEGLLQLYIGCSRNVIEGNHTFTGSLDPKYHIYLGVHSTSNAVRNNVLNGTCGKAYIALESAWDNGVANAAHRNYGLVDATAEDYANAASVDNEISDNVISGASAVPAIWLAQVNSDATVCALTGTRVSGNAVVGNGYTYQLALYEDNATSLSGVALLRNAFDPAATSAKFLLPRGRAHCSVVDGNTVLDIGSQSVTFTAADTTPSVALAKVFKTADTSTYTDFDDGVDGQQFYLLALHAAVVTNGTNIKTSTGSNKTLTVNVLYSFVSIGGVWYEIATA